MHAILSRYLPERPVFEQPDANNLMDKPTKSPKHDLNLPSLMTTRVVWYIPGDEWSIFLTPHIYCPVSLMFTRWISRVPSLVMLTLSRPTFVIPVLCIPAIQSHVVSLWSHLLDVQTFQYIMSNVPSFLITSCNAGQGKVTFNWDPTKEKMVWDWCFWEGLGVGTHEGTSPCDLYEW